MENFEERQKTEMKTAEKKISRRDFIDWVIKGGLLATFSGMLFPALAYLWPVMGHGPGSDMQEVAKVDEIPVGGAKKVILAGSALLLIRTAQEFLAFSAICTHLGCVVDWNSEKKEILCPCHAGVFDLQGKVVSGPPPRPLPSYAIRVTNGKVFLKL